MSTPRAASLAAGWETKSPEGSPSQSGNDVVSRQTLIVRSDASPQYIAQGKSRLAGLPRQFKDLYSILMVDWEKA